MEYYLWTELNDHTQICVSGPLAHQDAMDALRSKVAELESAMEWNDRCNHDDSSVSLLLKKPDGTVEDSVHLWVDSVGDEASPSEVDA